MQTAPVTTGFCAKVQMLAVSDSEQRRRRRRRRATLPAEALDGENNGFMLMLNQAFRALTPSVGRVKGAFRRLLYLNKVCSASLKSVELINGLCCYGRCPGPLGAITLRQNSKSFLTLALIYPTFIYLFTSNTTRW